MRRPHLFVPRMWGLPGADAAALECGQTLA